MSGHAADMAKVDAIDPTPTSASLSCCNREVALSPYKKASLSQREMDGAAIA
jgi:hypothetical protein